jgi:hypothetical protein
VTLAIFGCLLLLLRALLVDRQALGLLTTSFGARAPRAPGAVHDCRVCGAPLPEVPGTDQLLWRCIYCRSDNIVGPELAAETSVAVGERRSLRDALRWRRLARPALLLGMLVLVFTAAYLTTTIDVVLTIRELHRQWRWLALP